MMSSSHDDNSDADEDAEAEDEARRKREISMFSAMAMGGSVNFGGSATTDETDNDTSHNDDSPFHASSSQSKGTHVPTAHNIANGGTFNSFRPVPTETNGNGNATASHTNHNMSHNIEAAMASLTGQSEPPMLLTDMLPPTPSNAHHCPQQPQRDWKDTPMHSERVLLPRPLFFGPVLPPRVLKEVRRIVGDAQKQQLQLQQQQQQRQQQQQQQQQHQQHNKPKQHNQNKQQQLGALQEQQHLLPPHVCNLIGTIHSFGFGLSPYPEENDDESDPSYYTGNPYLSTYQPVWGDAVRADREWKRIRAQKILDKAAAAAAATAAAAEMSTRETDRNMFAAWAQSTMSDDAHGLSKDTDTDRAMFSAWAQSSSVMDDTDPPRKKADIERNMFAAWAQGGVENDTDGYASSKQDASTLSPPTDKKPPPPPPPSSPLTDKTLFSRLARGENSRLVTAAPREGKDPGSTTKSKRVSPPSSMPSGSNRDVSIPKSPPEKKKQSLVPQPTPSSPLTDKTLFSRLARGEKSRREGKDQDGNTLSPPSRSSIRDLSIPTSPPDKEKQQLTQSPPTSPRKDKKLFSRLAQARSDKARLAAAARACELKEQEDASSVATTTTSTSTATRPASPPIPPPSKEQALFSMWARGETESPPPASTEPISTEQETFSMWALGNSSNGSFAVPSLSERDNTLSLSSSGLSNLKKNISSSPSSGAGATFGAGTFRHVAPISDDSDDDSVVGSEMKKKVGINEHLDAALASLAAQEDGDGAPERNASESLSPEESQALLSQLGQTNLDGRPLSNFEITNGCIPVFGIDDPALPVESDLGIYETKEDQIRSLELRRAHEIVEKHTMPDVFGTIACPNPATGPDDTHSSSLRTTVVSRNKNDAKSVPSIPPVETTPPARKANSATPKTPELGPTPTPPNLRKSTSLPAKPLDGKPPRSTSAPTSKGSSTPTQTTSISSTTRYGTMARHGWWNEVDEEGSSDSNASPRQGGSVDDGNNSKGSSIDGNSEEDEPLIQIRSKPASDALLVQTRLEPTPAQLRKENAPLSRLHSATSVASCLPFLSDRPPSWRYLQIDTKAIGFPPLHGEVEPLFCSLAIYHVETNTSNEGAPVPNLQKCGRVTEILHFDVISDKSIEERCFRALWPYYEDEHDSDETNANGSGGGGEPKKKHIKMPSESERTQGTRCGVFPVPSNLNIANLYAILVIEKVLSNEADTRVYKSKVEENHHGSGLERYREKAERACDRQGQFLMPFSFGVTPLLQVFGTDVPTSPTSRAAQIPLFQFTPGQSERQIIDHIMIMLFPRADHQNIAGPAPVTNGGTAMLIMRDFGYLGLHSVVHNKSSLARHRLVDFTGELQIRRMHDDDAPVVSRVVDKASSPRDYVVQPWRRQYTSEPTQWNGRNIVPMRIKGYATNPADDEALVDKTKQSSNLGRSTLYAQELAAIPLQPSPEPGRSFGGAPHLRVNRNRFGLQNSGSEPYFHTFFCNELLCNPRLVHNCPKGNIVTKVELRLLEWDEDFSSHIARLPTGGPHLHNQRRGPAFVSEAFTSCTPSSVHFLNEFKVKLPLILSDPKGGRLVLLFSVYHVEIKPKRAWTDRLSLSRATSDEKKKKRQQQMKTAVLEPLGCGYLPITTDSGEDLKCLIDNGLHDVKLTHDAKPIAEVGLQGNKNGDDVDDDDPLVLIRKVESPQAAPTEVMERIGETDTVSVFEDEAIDAVSSIDKGDVDDRESVTSRDTSSSIFRISESTVNLISLQISIIVHSSVHPQNATLNEFLQRRPNFPLKLSIPMLPLSSPWKLKSREEILGHVQKELKATSGVQQSGEHGQKILAGVMEVCKSSVCSGSILAANSIRIVEQLITLMVSGTGEPSLLWANPALVLPLRINSFATLLHFLHTASSHFSKFGLTQLDGKSKWNVTTFGRILSLVFDEDKLFSSNGDAAAEPLDIATWESVENNKKETKLERPKLVQRKSSGARRRHNRGGSGILFDAIGERSPSSIGEKSPSTTSEMMNPDPKAINSLSIELSDLGFSDFSASATLPANITAALNPPSKVPGETPTKKIPAVVKSPFEQVASEMNTQAPIGLSFRDRLAKSFESDDGDSLLSGFGGGGLAGSRRKFMTLPTNALATIREDQDVVEEIVVAPSRPSRDLNPMQPQPASSAIDSEIVIRTEKTGERRLGRIPNFNKSNTSQNQEETKKKATMSDEEIESAGSAFLDQIGANLGFTVVKAGGSLEDQQVGGSHRKTRSRCSIDWTIPGDDDLMAGAHPSSPDKPNQENEFPSSLAQKAKTLKAESENAKRLPSYLDRVLYLARTQHVNGRWFPYVYEVLIFQWVATLTEQQRRTEKRQVAGNEATKPSNDYSFNNNVGRSPLREAAARARGYAVSCSPVLFEIIKKSLGARLHSLLRQADASPTAKRGPPPVVHLDGVILANLETLITMVTDACIDSRNFDSREFQQTSIDLNDSIVRFLRDLFAFLDPGCVHRLILVYFSRFVVKDGKQWHSRDSKIGLRCSWEICKLRLNAITALVRFPDFVRVNSPQMYNWPITSSNHMTRPFFDEALQSVLSLGMPSFMTTDGPHSLDGIKFPGLKPHWLAELVVDICLSGSDHAEQKIQHRASSLLHELFWSHSTQGKVNGNSSIVAGMYVPFLLKILSHISYLSSLGAKSQLRKDLMPCVVFVLQSAPIGLLRAFWRTLCVKAEGKGSNPKYGAGPSTKLSNGKAPREDIGAHVLSEPHIFDMFSLLNLVLATFEYDGCEDNMDDEATQDDDNLVAVWAKEYLPSIKRDSASVSQLRRSPLGRRFQKEKGTKAAPDGPTYNSTSSRKWYSHDGSLVAINSCRYMVREMLTMVTPGKTSAPASTPQWSRTSVSKAMLNLGSDANENNTGIALKFSHADTVIFVRGASTVYLHALSLAESDIVTIKTLTASLELIKIFGVSVFLEALGETLQHWLRVVMMQCGARRAHVRIQGLEFLALILRVTWDRFGSFFRIRMPLLAVQTEVMDRIVQFATARYHKEQRRLNAPTQYLSNDSAEASLSMFWRTLDRLHFQSASQNIAFRGALTKLAEKMKKLYRAYIAAHALSILKRSRSTLSEGTSITNEAEENFEAFAWHQIRRISVHRIVTNSANYSKQFLGLHGPMPDRETVAQNEAVEDAFSDAADVFSSTELPSHRVAWLEKLAEFHSDRQKWAEEAACHFQIQLTFRLAARCYKVIWSSVPFLPWTDSGVHIDGEGPAGELDEYYYDTDDFDDFDGVDSIQNVRQAEKTNSFRRIFYRIANSVRMRTGDWEISGNKHLFYGVTLVSEFGSSTAWMSLKEMEKRMIESAEAAGELYLKAGITESSRAAWSLATNYYAVRYDYAKLGHAYRRLSMVVASEVPVIDTNELALDFSHSIGRFYRVWFHGAAPDDLQGVEFVYRAPTTVKLQQFGKRLADALKGILRENTPIDLVLDDGRPEEAKDWKSAPRRALGPTPLEPVKIKITPLRALLKRAHKIRGTPEWFHEYTEKGFLVSSGTSSSQGWSGSRQGKTEMPGQLFAHHRKGNHSRSYSSSIFGSSGAMLRANQNGSTATHSSLGSSGSSKEDVLVGVDKFSFLQPIKRDRNRSSRDWLKSGDFAARSLRVTQLQVERSFPACVARQKVADRSVFKQSPLEAGVDALCTWCAVLFRTAVSTNGMRVLGTSEEHGIGNAAAKVVADCIHSSRVKEMGISLLKEHGYVAEEAEADYGALGSDSAKLPEEEVRRLQIKLARAIVLFIEMLHLLITRNRDLLLAVVEARKESREPSSNPFNRHGAFTDLPVPLKRRWRSAGGPPTTLGPVRTSSSSVTSPGRTKVQHISKTNSMPMNDASSSVDHHRKQTDGSMSLSVGSTMSNDRTDLAIAVQSELQRAFISMCKALYPNISRVLEGETPRWLRLCSQDNYFSSYAYRSTVIPMADELCFFDGDNDGDSVGLSDNDESSYNFTGSLVSSVGPGAIFSHIGTATDDSSVASTGSNRLRTRQHHKRPSNESLHFQLV